MTPSDPPIRIPARGGDEQGVFSRRARPMLCWTQKAGACRRAKRAYNRRLRGIARRGLSRMEVEA